MPIEQVETIYMNARGGLICLAARFRKRPRIGRSECSYTSAQDPANRGVRLSAARHINPPRHQPTMELPGPES